MNKMSRMNRKTVILIAEKYRDLVKISFTYLL